MKIKDDRPKGFDIVINKDLIVVRATTRTERGFKHFKKACKYLSKALYDLPLEAGRYVLNSLSKITIDEYEKK